MPELEMSVEVQVGQRQITLTPLTNWIEKKLIVELEVSVLNFLCSVYHFTRKSVLKASARSSNYL